MRDFNRILARKPEGKDHLEEARERSNIILRL
jgi:hypothetical protein